jgi:hypothetical protein
MNTDEYSSKIQHPEANDEHYGTSMSWPDCNCIGCVYREIAQQLHVGLFSAWCEWPERTVASNAELMRHIGHTATLHFNQNNDSIVMTCHHCKVTLVLNRGRQDTVTLVTIQD